MPVARIYGQTMRLHEFCRGFTQLPDCAGSPRDASVPVMIAVAVPLMRSPSRKRAAPGRTQPPRSPHPVGPSEPVPERRDDKGVLLSDEPTMELVVRAQDGDRRAVEAL